MTPGKQSFNNHYCFQGGADVFKYLSKPLILLGLYIPKQQQQQNK